MKAQLRTWWWLPIVILASVANSIWVAQLPPEATRVAEEVERISDLLQLPAEEFTLRSQQVRGDILTRSYDYTYEHVDGKAVIELCCIRGLLGDDGFCHNTETATAPCEQEGETD